jgi:glycosyltransferase involved in cell wall biosynthesis
MTSLAFFPVITEDAQLIDLVSRAAWSLSFCPIDTIYIPVASEDLTRLAWSVAPGMDDSIVNKFDALRRMVEFVVADQENDIERIMNEASIILCWKKDQIPSFVRPTSLAAWEKGKRVWQVETGLHLLRDKELLIRENQLKFERFAKRLGKYKRAYVMATGPSVSRYRLYDYSESLGIVCNSVILDEELMATVRPKILVFADPIFHFGPSQYAAEFRAKLRESAVRHDYTICIPFKYYALFVAAMPELASRTIGIPFKERQSFNFDLSEEFSVRTTANILTLLLIPLATTFSDRVSVLGCDGRPLKDNGYFWNHNPNTQINDKMANIREIHPGFFAIDYNDYYREHCETLANQMEAGEARGKEFISLGYSHIPALKSRIEVGDRRDSELLESSASKVLLIDPDAKGWSGHYMAYNEKLSGKLKKLGADVRVICRKDLDPKILETRPDYIPAISAHSWEIGNRSENGSFLRSFETEILEVLSKECAGATDCLLYMYCSSLAHAKALAKIQTQYPFLRINVNLFYLSFTISPEWISSWKAFVEWLDASDGNFNATLPTVELRDELAELTGCVLPVAPHPSTGILDETFLKMETHRQTPRRKSKFEVLFPSAPRFEKGYLTSVECARLLGAEPGVNTIVRHSPTFSTPKALAKPLESMPANATVIEGELSDCEFVDLFSRSDIVVLPYTAEAFAKRTSGLLIDAMYHGIPCVVVDGTWLANVVRYYGCGEIVKDASAAHLAAGVLEIAANYADYQSRSAAAAVDYFSRNSWEVFGRFLLQPYPKFTDSLGKRARVPGGSAVGTMNRDPDALSPKISAANRVSSLVLDAPMDNGKIIFRCVVAENDFLPRQHNVWRCEPRNGHKPSKWMAVFGIDACAGRGFASGLTIRASANVQVRVSLARHGVSAYEGTAKTVVLTSGVPITVGNKAVFANPHAALKVQIEVLSVEGDASDLTISGVYLNETAVGIRQRLGDCEVDLHTANRLFRSGDYVAAMDLYLQLNTVRPFAIYRDNALASARRMKWGNVSRVEDLVKRLNA